MNYRTIYRSAPTRISRGRPVFNYVTDNDNQRSTRKFQGTRKFTEATFSRMSSIPRKSTKSIVPAGMDSIPRTINPPSKAIKQTHGNKYEPDVSIPGLMTLFNDSGCTRKTIWGLAVAFCVTYCFFQVRSLLIEFWNVPVTVGLEIIRDENPLFPAVTICPFYPFRYNLLLLERLKTTERERITPSYHPIFSLLQLPDENVTNLWQYGRVQENDVKTILICKNYSTETNCHLKVIRKEFITYLGICSSFTLSDRIQYDGSYNGIHIFYYQHGNKGDIHHTLIFHHPDEDPTHFLFKDAGIYVNSFERTHIVYSRQEFRNQDIRRNPCLPRKNVIECFGKCIEQAISKHVTCKLPYMMSSLLQLCSTTESAEHTYNVTLQVYQRMDGLCRQCPRKCEDDLYRFSETSLTQHNYTYLTIHMVDNVVQVVTEITVYTVDKVLSDIGGMLGLFMGVCLLSGIQLAEALFDRIKLKWKTRHQRTSRKLLGRGRGLS